MTNSELIEQLLESLVTLLDAAGGPAWTPTLENLLHEVRAVRGDDAEHQRVVRRILRLYTGGMGGFGDLVLQANGQVLAEQHEFDMVRQRLFEVAREQLA